MILHLQNSNRDGRLNIGDLLVQENTLMDEFARLFMRTRLPKPALTYLSFIRTRKAHFEFDSANFLVEHLMNMVKKVSGLPDDAEPDLARNIRTIFGASLHKASRDRLADVEMKLDVERRRCSSSALALQPHASDGMKEAWLGVLEPLCVPQSTGDEAPTPLRVHSLVDLQAVAMGQGQGKSKNTPSLKRVCARVLGRRLDKEQQCSDWSRRPLERSQFTYAALDAYVLLEIHAALTEQDPDGGL